VYRPQTGRWLSRDPLGVTGNLYAYSDTRPVAIADPSGAIAPAALLAIGACVFMLVEAAEAVRAQRKTRARDKKTCCLSPKGCHKEPWTVTVTDPNGKKRSFQCWHPDMPCGTQKYPVRVRYAKGKGWGDWHESKLRGNGRCTV
jgi:uncharacterized protein RhaS with RHS repeats